MAFTILQTGVFSSERSKETTFGGVADVQSTLRPAGSIIAFRGKVGTTDTVYKVSILLENPPDGSVIDLTPKFTANGSGTDPDSSSGLPVPVITYTDSNQRLSSVPWTLNFLGPTTNNIVNPGDRVELQVWLLNRDTSVAQSANNSVSYMSAGDGGFTSSNTLLTPNDKFTIELKFDRGAVLYFQRTLPSKLDDVMSLK